MFSCPVKTGSSRSAKCPLNHNPRERWNWVRDRCLSVFRAEALHPSRCPRGCHGKSPRRGRAPQSRQPHVLGWWRPAFRREHCCYLLALVFLSPLRSCPSEGSPRRPHRPRVCKVRFTHRMRGLGPSVLCFPSVLPHSYRPACTSHPLALSWGLFALRMDFALVMGTAAALWRQPSRAILVSHGRYVNGMAS